MCFDNIKFGGENTLNKKSIAHLLKFPLLQKRIKKKQNFYHSLKKAEFGPPLPTNEFYFYSLKDS